MKMTQAQKNKANEIRQQAATKWNCDVKEIDWLSCCWMAIRGEELEPEQEAIIEKFNYQPSGGKTWVAEITGTCEKWGFKREFLDYYDIDTSSSGKTGVVYYKFESGKIYQVNEAWKRKGFYHLVNGELEELPKGKVKEMFA